MIINNFIRGIVDAQQASIDDISLYTGLSVEKIEDIIDEKVGVCPNEAYRILKALGFSLEDILEAW